MLWAVHSSYTAGPARLVVVNRPDLRCMLSQRNLGSIDGGSVLDTRSGLPSWGGDYFCGQMARLEISKGNRELVKAVWETLLWIYSMAFIVDGHASAGLVLDRPGRGGKTAVPS